MSSLADRIARAAPEILRGADALAGEVVAALVHSLRTDEEPPMIATRLTADALARALRVVRSNVLDAIAGSAAEVRRVSEWFAEVSERALGDAHRRFTAMLDALDDRVILLDPDARVLFLNRASEAAARGMHGVSRADMVGRSSIAGTHSAAYEQLVAGRVARARAGETVAGEFLLPMPDGAIWHEHTFHPVRGDAGEVEAIAVSSRDIHARKLAEGRLQLLSKIGVLAESVELDDVLARAAGLAVPELADWSVFELVHGGAIQRSTIVHPDEARRAAAAALLVAGRSAAAGERARIVDVRDPDEPLRVADPALFALLAGCAATTAIAVPFTVLGAPIAVATFVYGPESGRRHAAADLAIADEIARRAAQIVENARLHAELAQALAYRERVMGILGHDLRNPVAAVLSLAATLGQRADVPERTKEGLRHIHTAAARMNQMIATILDFTRLRFHGALTLALDHFDLGTLARGILDELRAAHPGRDIACAAQGDLRGRWDASRLGQVIANLVGNALTHGARDAPVTVELRGDAQHAVLAVHNHGPAIPADMIGKLFEPFAQGSEAARSRGLGLGLLIVQQIVHAHGGDITVRSADDRTTFTVRLPR